MDYKVLIADDDEGMRLVLKKILEKAEGFELAGECGDGECALRLAEALKPHIAFLDVEMPVIDGLECAKRIMDINPRTFIIFATAHEEYMPKAFEVYAFDYLVKPFKVERIRQTLDRIKELGRQEDVHTGWKAARHEKGLEKLVIRNKEGISFIDMDEIILIQREEGNTAVYTAEDRYVTSEGLSELEERLDKKLFFRCHKSYIINLSMIRKVSPYGRWTYIVKLRNTDKDALVTHDRYEELEKLFGQ